jgi:hypothetical protein
MTTMAEMEEYEVIYVNSTNGVTTDILFSFNSQVPLETNDRMEINFPDEVDLPSNPDCEVVLNIEQISCRASWQALTVYFDKIDTDYSIGDFKFQLTDI